MWHLLCMLHLCYGGIFVTERAFNFQHPSPQHSQVISLSSEHPKIANCSLIKTHTVLEQIFGGVRAFCPHIMHSQLPTRARIPMLWLLIGKLHSHGNCAVWRFS